MAIETTTAELEVLRERFRGQLLRPGDDGYDETRAIWNGAIDRRPALIARCTGIADVCAAVRFARERDLLVAVRGGGHGVAGQAVCDDGLMIDLSPMKGISVDPETRTARAEAGVLLGELDEATQALGLATTAGIVTHTGIAGLTLGGGIGWLMRKFGVTVDNLLSADLVTASGELVHASEDENTDLFWGLRGGGGNFGIATSFEYRLHPVGPTVLAGPVYYPLEEAREVLRRYRDVVAGAPDELTTILNLRMAPPLGFLPAELHGRPVAVVAACYAGPVEAGEKVVQPLRELGTVLFDALGPKPYLELQRMFDASVPHGWHYYWKTWELPPFSDGAIDTLVEHSFAVPTSRSYTIIFQLGGAISRVGEDDTAYPQRDAAFNVNINTVWLPGDEAEGPIAWARDFHSALESSAGGRAYVNFLGDEAQDRVRAAYGAEKYERLATLKRKYDPTNVFRLNQNIRPE